MNILEYENYQEKKPHGSEAFPYITYPCSIPLDFTGVPTHWHDEMELIYIKKGTGIITVDLEQYQVYAGSILLIIPGQLHSISQYESDSMEYENIIFKPEILLTKQADTCNGDYFLPLLDGTLQLPTLFEPQMPHYSQIASCIDSADDICKTCPAAYQLVIKGQLYLLFYTLFSQYCQKQVRRKDSKSLDKMKQIIKYIENNYMEKITIETMAKELDLSQSHFMKFFKNTMGTTFIDYLNDYRLTMASRLLVSSESSVLYIATEVGFDNLSYFNRLFKQRFTVTPREYRNQFHAN
jgi:AraC-like DNA-binding protein